MKKLYITFVVLLILGISSGIFYLTVVREAGVEIAEDVEFRTAYGDPFTLENPEKKARLIEFMYTNCPDICPATTIKMMKLKKRLEEEEVFGSKVEFLTITIDPKRDTHEVLRDYAEKFSTQGDGWYFLRADEATTRQVADSFGFLYRDPGNGMIIHSSFSYFLNGDNVLVKQFGMGNGFDEERVYKRIMNTID